MVRCSEVSIYPSWTLVDVPTSGSILNYSHLVQTVHTSRLRTAESFTNIYNGQSLTTAIHSGAAGTPDQRRVACGRKRVSTGQR